MPIHYLVIIVSGLAMLIGLLLWRRPVRDGLLALGGGLLGLTIGDLLVAGIVPPQVPAPAVFALHLLFFAGGAALALAKRDELSLIFPALTSAHPAAAAGGMLLDTSVIIDGRIVDVCKSRFISGELLIPRFILRELQSIADSADGLRRQRGRRGLDVIKQLQGEPHVTVRIVEQDFPETAEVDAKLIKLARLLGGRIFTNDYNLNKVADLQGVGVLNLNDLANALKPVVLPGELLTVQVMKEGKEHGQGVGYLDDGTMVVVDNGRAYLGRKLRVVVTSIIQTSAGRMIFTRYDTSGS